MPMIPFNEWSAGRRGHILACWTCYLRMVHGRRSTLRNGGVPIYKTERGAGAHGDRFPRHEIVSVQTIRDFAYEAAS